jgi:HAD superfamily hydrolase (TIGR01509 family)
MNSPDLISFACEGVLVDSELVAARAGAETLAEAGIEIDADGMAERFAGRTFRDILLELERETGRPLQVSLIGKAEGRIDERLRREAKATEGVLRIVAGVPRRCACSGATRERMAIMLERAGLKPLFEGATFSVEDTETQRPKPAPDLFLFAAGRMGARPERTFVVESTAAGVAAAVAAGMRAIGYTGASHGYPGLADALTEAGAETVISRWSGFLPVLLALSDWRDG